MSVLVTLCGATIGIRVCRRIRRRWGISANWPYHSDRTLSSSVSGSPPLRMTSRIVGSAATIARAASQRRVELATARSPAGKWRRKQKRQWTPHWPVATIRSLPAYFHSTPEGHPVEVSPGTQEVSPSGSVRKPAAAVRSSARGITCNSRGSSGSPGCIRWTYGRGTNKGNGSPGGSAVWLVAAGNPNRRHNSAGSRTASAKTVRQSGVVAAGQTRLAAVLTKLLITKQS